MTGRVRPADDELFGGPVHLHDDVDAASTRLDELIGSHSGELHQTYVALAALVDRIRDDDRLHRVERAHRAAGVPPLRRRAVKWVLCRYRLQQAALEIESHPSVDHADLAVRLGWYDQDHFIDDFRTMLGCTPGDYAAAHGS